MSADPRVEAVAKAMAERAGEGWVFEPPRMDGITRSAAAPEVWIRKALSFLAAADAVDPLRNLQTLRT